MQYQLRDYRISPESMAQFIEEWRRHVVPMRERWGFEVVGAWSSADTNRFVWVVGFDGDFEEADRGYYGSAERKAMTPDPARFIQEARKELVRTALEA